MRFLNGGTASSATPQVRSRRVDRCGRVSPVGRSDRSELEQEPQENTLGTMRADMIDDTIEIRLP